MHPKHAGAGSKKESSVNVGGLRLYKEKMMVEVEVKVVVWDENQEQQVGGGGGGGGGGRVFNLPSRHVIPNLRSKSIEIWFRRLPLAAGGSPSTFSLALGDFFENHYNHI